MDIIRAAGAAADEAPIDGEASAHQHDNAKDAEEHLLRGSVTGAGEYVGRRVEVRVRVRVRFRVWLRAPCASRRSC